MIDILLPLHVAVHLDKLHLGVQFNYLHKMISTRRNKYQLKRQLSLLNETLNDFVLGNSNTICAIELQDNGLYRNAEKNLFGETSTCQNQVIENNIDDKIG